MQLKSDKYHPKKRKNLINERKKRTYIDSEGIERHWTLQYVADQIEKKFGRKITASLIGQIERGQINGSLKTLKMLSSIYGKSIEELMN